MAISFIKKMEKVTLSNFMADMEASFMWDKETIERGKRIKVANSNLLDLSLTGKVTDEEYRTISDMIHSSDRENLTLAETLIELRNE